MAEVHGSCDDRFSGVREALGRNLDAEELGASIAVDLDGETVVDLWGGFRDAERTTPWTRDTIVNVWSTTKTVLSLAALMLVDRGELDVYAPVGNYWPEFSAKGKKNVEVRHLMSHTSGVSGWEQPFSIRDMYDWATATERLAQQRPWWEPGTASGYHANNQGHLVGEVIRRITNTTFKQFVADEIARPLGADFQVGARESDWGRIAPVVPPPRPDADPRELDPASVMVKTYTGPVASAKAANSPEWRRADLGALNGHSNARGVLDVLRVLSLGGEVGGRRLLSQKTIDLDLRPAVRRRRPGAGRAVPVRHRLLPGLTGDPVRALGTHLLLGRLGWLDDRDGPRPAADDQLHDEPHGGRHPRLRPGRGLRAGRLRRGRLRLPAHVQPAVRTAAASWPRVRGMSGPAEVTRGWWPRLPRRRLVLLAAVAVLAVEAYLIGPTLGGAVAALATAQPGWIAVAAVAAATSMSMFSRGRRRLMRAAGVEVPARSALAAVYVAHAMHATLPGGAAFSTAYTFRWMRSWGASPTTATWTLASGGVVASAMLAALGLVGSLLVGSSAGLVPLSLAVAGVLLAAVAARRLQRRPDVVLSIARWALARADVLRRRPADAHRAALEQLVAQLRAVRPRPVDWAVAAAFALGNWVFDVACLAASALALGVTGLTPALLLLVFTAGMAAASFSLVPGGIGVVDAAMVLAFVAGGVPAAAALPAVLLYRLISLVGVVSAGWVVAALQARRRRRRRCRSCRGPRCGAWRPDRHASSITRRCSSVVSWWISRVSWVLVLSSSSCSRKSWLALACWKAAARFWPIITKVDRKMASRETTRVRVGQGLRSANSIQTAKTTTCT